MKSLFHMNEYNFYNIKLQKHFVMILSHFLDISNIFLSVLDSIKLPRLNLVFETLKILTRSCCNISFLMVLGGYYQLSYNHSYCFFWFVQISPVRNKWVPSIKFSHLLSLTIITDLLLNCKGFVYLRADQYRFLSAA